jgi:hypothetical protein
VSNFGADLALRIARQIAIAHDPRNLVDEIAGESLVGQPVLHVSGRPMLHRETGQIMYEVPPRGGWVPGEEKLVGSLEPDPDFIRRIAPPDTWREVDHLYPHLRIKAHQAGWETPVALVYHLVRVQRPETPEPVTLRVLTIQFDFRGRLMPAELKAAEGDMQALAASFGGFYFHGIANLGWSMDCGEPVPKLASGGASEGNVSFRTPVMLRVIAQHDDPEGKAIVAAAQAPEPVLE